MRQQRAFCRARERKAQPVVQDKHFSLCLQAVISSVPVATATLGGSQKACESISFLEGMIICCSIYTLGSNF